MELAQNYYEQKLESLLDEIVEVFVQNKPKDPVEFLKDYLINKGDYHNCSKKLNNKEIKELVELRKIYNQLQDEMKNNIKKKNVNNNKKRQGVSSESYGIYNLSQKNYTPAVIAKNKEQIDKIIKKLQQSILFKELNLENLTIVANAMKEEIYYQNDYIIVEGEEGDKMFFVEKGTLECYKNLLIDENWVNKCVKTYGSGDSFGELSLLYNSPRSASIISVTDSILWSLDRETFHFIFKKLNIDKDHF